MNRNCPECGQEDLHHSHLRTFGEKLKYNLIGKSPFRCHSCGWRGWFYDTPDSHTSTPAAEQQAPKAESIVGDLMSEDEQERQHQKRRA